MLKAKKTGKFGVISEIFRSELIKTMKNKQYQSGFTLQSAFCDTCVFTVEGGHKKLEGRKFYGLKEEICSAMQDLHLREGATACNGNLTIVYDTAVREI